MADPDSVASEIADRLMSSQAASSSSSGPVWREEWAAVLPELQELARRRGKGIRDVAVMRASQLDAGRLDTELTAMLSEQFMRIFSLLQPRVISAFQPELTLLLDFLIFKFTVWSGRPTPGSSLMNLRYRNERQAAQQLAQPAADPNALPKSSTAPAQEAMGRSGLEGAGLSKWQRGLYGLGVVFLRYIWARADQFSASQHWGDLPRRSWGWLAWRGMHGAEMAFKLASLLNFLAFLRYGKYRSVLERVLGARLVYEQGSMARALSFEYLNRQLVWHELSELLLFLLPLLNVARIKAFVMARLPRIAPAPSSPLPSPSSPGCLICGAAEVGIPYAAQPCGHTFCYYCLRAHTLADPGYKCLACGVPVTAMRRWRPPSAGGGN